METILTTIHIFAALFMIGVVLLQAGKGSGMGAAFGGGQSQAMFGNSSGMSFMGKLTAGVATVFMLTSISLAYLASTQDSVVDDIEQPTVNEQPKLEDAQPEETPAAAESTPAAESAGETPPEVIIKDKDGNPMNGIKVERVNPEEMKKAMEAKAAAEGEAKPPAEDKAKAE